MTTPTPAPAQTAPAMTSHKGLTPDQQQQALDALHKTEAGLDAGSAATTAAVATTPAMTTPKPAAPSPTPMTKPAAMPMQPAAKPAPVVTPAPVAAPAVAAVPMTDSKSKPMAGMTNMPAMGSPAPEPGSKAARLEDLLQQYRSGAIGPAEYQERRTKIRAEPDK